MGAAERAARIRLVVSTNCAAVVAVGAAFYTGRVAEDLDKLFDRQVDLPPPGEPLDRRRLPGGGGVYAFTDGSDRVVQIIGAQSLRRSIAFRLEPPDEETRRRRADLRAVARRVHWTPTHSTFETSLVYLRIARKLMPQDYRRHLAFGPVWFARVNPDDRFPRWVPDSIASRGDGVDIGPFTDHDRCTGFIELLEELFDLCRKYSILLQAPNGEPCVYFEMGKCPAPCDGSVSPDEYRSMIRRSVAFARGDPDPALRELEQRMKQAAADFAFERAAHIKATLDRARKILANDGRLVPVPEQFRYLVVQRAGGRSRVKPFFVDRGHIIEGDTVRLKQVPEVAQAWADRMKACHHSGTLDPMHDGEGMWLVSHFVVKGDRAPGLFLPASQLGDGEALARRITARFTRPGRRSENDSQRSLSDTHVDSRSG